MNKLENLTRQWTWLLLLTAYCMAAYCMATRSSKCNSITKWIMYQRIDYYIYINKLRISDFNRVLIFNYINMPRHNNFMNLDEPNQCV